MASKKTARKANNGARVKAEAAQLDAPAAKKTVVAAATNSQPTTKPLAGEKSKFSIAPGPTPEFANGQQLAKAIAEKCDLVAVGSKLLSEDESKGASVRARMFETTVEYLYGKPASAAAPEAARIVFVCDIPRPQRDTTSK
jgi:hypothetical protein